MNREVFLEKNRSKTSKNAESNISLDLQNKQRLLPFDSAAETMSLYQLYNKQRDVCSKYRLIFNINPYCTNVLFNTISEPVWREGSSSAICLTFSTITKSNTDVFPNGTINDTDVDLKQAIRDTEYSHPDIGGIVYHCGYDIFNNHLLRSEDFLHVQQAISGQSGNSDVFNTIYDWMVDNEGVIVEERGGRSFRKLGKIPLHMYSIDNSLSLVNTYLTKISEENGWYGFTNVGYINIPNARLPEGNKNEVSINRVMNNNKPCEFYDMYPDRSLFSFIPKVNKWRKRTEKNWDYKITYPYYSDIDKFNELNNTPSSVTEDEKYRLNALKCISVDLNYMNSGIKLIRCKTLFNHGLSKGDYVRFYYMSGGTLERYYNKVRVQKVGDYEGYDADKYFSVSYSDVTSFVPLTESGGEMIADKVELYIRQERGGAEFVYYLRKFKGLDIEPRSEINKTAYQETIYGDRSAQIVYTDDVDVSNLVDNLGRPLTSLYLTIVKNNRGHEEWYSGNISGETIEFSHCFGEVTSGFDLGNDTNDYNIRKLHNIDRDALDNPTKEMLGWVGVSATPLTVESAITIENDEFYGDIACFDPYDYIEYILMPLYHRFNTAQRELVNDMFLTALTYDEIIADDYDYKDPDDTSGQGGGGEDLKSPYIIVGLKCTTGDTVWGKTLTGSVESGGEGDALVARIFVTADPRYHVGNLVLIDEYGCADMSRNGDEYKIQFRQNNSESGRTIHITGTVSTDVDLDYSGTSSMTINYTINQAGKEYPYGYRMTIGAEPTDIQVNQNGVARVTIEKVWYFDEGDESESNIFRRETYEIQSNDATCFTWSTWTENELASGYTFSQMMRTVVTEPGGITFTNIIPLEYENDVSNVCIQATFEKDGKTCTAIQKDIILRHMVKVWVYELTVTPSTATATTLNPASYKAILFSTISGETIPYPPEGLDVTNSATWELSSDVTSYAAIENGTVTNNGTATDIQIGTVTAKYVVEETEELSDDAEVTITSNLTDEFDIIVEDDHVVSGTEVTITVTSKSDTTPQYNRTISVIASSGNPAHFAFEKGDSTLTYKVQLTRCVGDGSNSVSYSPYGEEKYNYTQLNNLISNIYYGFDDVNGSIFTFTGAKTFYTLNTTQMGSSTSTPDFGSVSLTFYRDLEPSSEVITSSELSIYGSKASEQFFVSDINDAQTGQSVENVALRLGGGILEGDKYKKYSIRVNNSAGNLVKNGYLKDLEIMDSNRNISIPRNDLNKSTWYIEKNKPIYSLEVIASGDNTTLEYSGVLHYEAFLVIDSDGETERINVTSAYTSNRKETTAWSVSGEARPYAYILSNNAMGNSGGTVIGKNNGWEDYEGFVVANYDNTIIPGGVHLSGSAPITVLKKQYQVAANIKVSVDNSAIDYINTSVLSDIFSQFTIQIDDKNVSKDVTGTDYLIGDKNVYKNIEGLKIDSARDLESRDCKFSWSVDRTKIDSEHINELYLYISDTFSESGDLYINLGPITGTNSSTYNIHGLTATIGMDIANLLCKVPFHDILIAVEGYSGVFGTRTKKKRSLKSTELPVIYYGLGETDKVTEFSKYMLGEVDEPIFTISANSGTAINRVDGDGELFYPNLNPEGYFYKPHNEIKIREFANELSSVDGININSDFSATNISIGFETIEAYDPRTGKVESGITAGLLSAVSPTFMDFIEGMEFVFYDKYDGNTDIVGRLMNYNEEYDTGGCQVSLWMFENGKAMTAARLNNFANDLAKKKYLMILKKQWCPDYAVYQPRLKKFIWRNIIPMSELTPDDELYDMVFANGRFYVHSNFNFFLRRQDPQNAFQLQSPNTEKYNPLKKFRVIGRDKEDFSSVIFFSDEDINGCLN